MEQLLQEKRSNYWYNYWKITADVSPEALVDSLPLFSKGLWKFFAIVFISWLFVNGLDLGQVKDLKRRLRPYLFLYYAFMSGVYGLGSILGALFTRCYLDIVTCQPVPKWSSMDFPGVVRIYVAYIAAVIKLINIMEAVFMRKSFW